jgi:hypothetical protein
MASPLPLPALPPSALVNGWPGPQDGKHGGDPAPFDVEAAVRAAISAAYAVLAAAPSSPLTLLDSVTILAVASAAVNITSGQFGGGFGPPAIAAATARRAVDEAALANAAAPSPQRRQELESHAALCMEEVLHVEVSVRGSGEAPDGKFASAAAAALSAAEAAGELRRAWRGGPPAPPAQAPPSPASSTASNDPRPDPAPEEEEP